MERIRRDGYSEVLAQLADAFKSQQRFKKCLKETSKSQFLVVHHHEGSCWYYEGVIELPSTVISTTKGCCIEVDVKRKELLRVNGEDVSGIEHNQVLDLSDDGVRWEGDVLQNKPYGWGVLYDSENRMVYEGFRIGEVNVCYGTRYYSDIGVIEYEGEWCEGKRWGKGVQFDRYGKTVFDGEWMNDEQLNKRVVLSEDNLLLHNHIEDLIMSHNSCNGPEWTTLDLSLMSKLRLLEVGDECFAYVKEVKMIGLNQLESVVIGKNCFIVHKNDPGSDTSGHFYLKNCERLRELKIARWSFSDYSICEIENLSSLEVIQMGEVNKESSNFYNASLELKSGFQRMN